MLPETKFNDDSFDRVAFIPTARLIIDNTIYEDDSIAIIEKDKFDEYLAANSLSYSLIKRKSLVSVVTENQDTDIRFIDYLSAKSIVSYLPTKEHTEYTIHTNCTVVGDSLLSD